MTMSKIIEYYKWEITHLSDKPEYDHLLKKTPFEWTENSLYFRNNIKDEKEI